MTPMNGIRMGASGSPDTQADSVDHGLRAALGMCLLGSVLAAFAAGRTWSTRVLDHGPALPLEHVSRTGQQVSPGLRPLALVGLAAVLALIATRGWSRRVVGLLVLGSGVGITWLVTAEARVAVWPGVALAGGLLLATGGLLALLRGHRWGGLSDAYRTPAARAEQVPATDKGVWDALDRGEDPTADRHG